MEVAVRNARSAVLPEALAGVEALLHLTGGRGAKAAREAALGDLHKLFSRNPFSLESLMCRECDRAASLGAMAALAGALARHAGDAPTCAAAAFAVRNIVGARQHHAHAFASAGGLEALTAALECHIRVEEVCMAACGALYNLAVEGGEVWATLKVGTNALPLLWSVQKRHPNVYDLACDAALRLEGDPKLDRMRGQVADKMADVAAWDEYAMTPVIRHTRLFGNVVTARGYGLLGGLTAATMHMEKHSLEEAMERRELESRALLKDALEKQQAKLRSLAESQAAEEAAAAQAEAAVRDARSAALAEACAGAEALVRLTGGGGSRVEREAALAKAWRLPSRSPDADVQALVSRECERAASSGALPALLGALSLHAGDADACAAACAAVRNIVGGKADLGPAFLEAGGGRPLLAALARHAGVEAVCRAACGAVLNLALVEGLGVPLKAAGALPLLSAAQSRHPGLQGLVAGALKCLGPDLSPEREGAAEVGAAEERVEVAAVLAQVEVKATEASAVGHASESRDESGLGTSSADGVPEDVGDMGGSQQALDQPQGGGTLPELRADSRGAQPPQARLGRSARGGGGGGGAAEMGEIKATNKVEVGALEPSEAAASPPTASTLAPSPFSEVVTMIGGTEAEILAGLSLLLQQTGGPGNAAEREEFLSVRHLPPPAEQAASFSSAGAIPALLGVLKGAHDAEVAGLACAGLRNLLAALGAEECAAVVAAGGVPLLVRTLTAHAASSAVCAPAVGALFNVSQANVALRPALAAEGVAAAVARVPAEVASGGVARRLLEGITGTRERMATPLLPAAVIAAGAAQRWAAAAGAAALVTLTGGEGAYGQRERVLAAEGAAYDARCAAVVAAGATPALCAALERHVDDASVCALAATALRNLLSTPDEKLVRVVVGEGAAPPLVAALHAHAAVEGVAKPAAGAIFNAVAVKGVTEAVGAVDGVMLALSLAAARVPAAAEHARGAMRRLHLASAERARASAAPLHPAPAQRAGASAAALAVAPAAIVPIVVPVVAVAAACVLT